MRKGWLIVAIGVQLYEGWAVLYCQVRCATLKFVDGALGKAIHPSKLRAKY